MKFLKFVTVALILGIGQTALANLNEELLDAVDDNNIERVAKLLDAGADVNYERPSSRPPFDGGEAAITTAGRKANASLVELLIQRGARPNHRDRHGMSSLMYAARIGHFGSVKLLVKARANSCFEGYNSKTASAMAREKGFVEIANYLDSLACRDDLQSQQDLLKEFMGCFISYKNEKTPLENPESQLSVTQFAKAERWYDSAGQLLPVMHGKFWARGDNAYNMDWLGFESPMGQEAYRDKNGAFWIKFWGYPRSSDGRVWGAVSVTTKIVRLPSGKIQMSSTKIDYDGRSVWGTISPLLHPTACH